MKKDEIIPLTIRVPASLKRRAGVAAAREGISLNLFIQRVLGDACPQENPLSDEAHRLAKLAAAYDEDSPEAARKALLTAIRSLSARLQATIEGAPVHEPGD